MRFVEYAQQFFWGELDPVLYIGISLSFPAGRKLRRRAVLLIGARF